MSLRAHAFAFTVSTLIAGAAASALTMGPAMAADQGTPDEAKAMVEKVVAHVAKAGLETAFKDFSDKSGAFVDRDLYVFCLSKTGDIVAHGANPALIGKNLMSMKDSDGKAFIAEMLSVKTGWVDYKWPNPTTKKIEPKSSYVAPVGDGVCGVGVYKG